MNLPTCCLTGKIFEMIFCILPLFSQGLVNSNLVTTFFTVLVIYQGMIFVKFECLLPQMIFSLLKNRADSFARLRPNTGSRSLIHL